MGTELDDLVVLQGAEAIADDVWLRCSAWDDFARDTVGKQLVRAADSIGANIAESFGRFSYGEKLQFLYYARGSLFETRYWLKRAATRALLPTDAVARQTQSLTTLARQINAFARSLKSQRTSDATTNKRVREAAADYTYREREGESGDWEGERAIGDWEAGTAVIFTDADLLFLSQP